MPRIRKTLIALERECLARVLAEAASAGAAPPRRRRLGGLRKVSEIVERIWLSGSCFGETVQWTLKPRRDR
ncbi:hypothetical protein HY251_11080 [bacterium]|nr:hypothetical protein [bacterium]